MCEYQIDKRLDGKYYCRIYQHDILGPIATSDDYIAYEDAIEVVVEIIQALQSNSENRELD